MKVPKFEPIVSIFDCSSIAVTCVMHNAVTCVMPHRPRQQRGTAPANMKPCTLTALITLYSAYLFTSLYFYLVRVMRNAQCGHIAPPQTRYSTLYNTLPIMATECARALCMCVRAFNIQKCQCQTESAKLQHTKMKQSSILQYLKSLVVFSRNLLESN